MSETLLRAAKAICQEFAEFQDGSIVRFLDDGHHCETFLERNCRAAVAAIKVLRDDLQTYAESLPIEDYGDWRQVVEWIDDAVGRKA